MNRGTKNEDFVNICPGRQILCLLNGVVHCIEMLQWPKRFHWNSFFRGSTKVGRGHNRRLRPNGEYDIPSSLRSSLLVLGDDEISLCFFLSRSKEGFELDSHV